MPHYNRGELVTNLVALVLMLVSVVGSSPIRYSTPTVTDNRDDRDASWASCGATIRS
jgi:hypothetical protein